MNPASVIINFFSKALCTLFSRIHVSEKGTISAYKKYEKKGRHDYERHNEAKLGKNERLTPSMLLKLKSCHSVEEATQALKRDPIPYTYIIRTASIWAYYELIDTQ